MKHLLFKVLCFLWGVPCLENKKRYMSPQSYHFSIKCSIKYLSQNRTYFLNTFLKVMRYFQLMELDQKNSFLLVQISSMSFF